MFPRVHLATYPIHNPLPIPTRQIANFAPHSGQNGRSKLRQIWPSSKRWNDGFLFLYKIYPPTTTTAMTTVGTMTAAAIKPVLGLDVLLATS